MQCLTGNYGNLDDLQQSMDADNSTGKWEFVLSHQILHSIQIRKIRERVT